MLRTQSIILKAGENQQEDDNTDIKSDEEMIEEDLHDVTCIRIHRITGYKVTLLMTNMTMSIANR